MNDAKPWLTEPDYLKWTDEATGYLCVILRVPHLGSLCGYVRVPHSNLRDRLVKYSHQVKGESLFNKKKAWRRSAYDHGAIRDIEVHGGLTFAGRLSRPAGGLHRGLWVGFDCGHAWDYMPALHEKMASLRWDISPGDDGGLSLLRSDTVYRDIAYVKDQCTKLAGQIRRRV